MLKSDVGPTGIFSKHDMYQRHWRHVQYLADLFWKRWTRQYLPELQSRQKWLKIQPNFEVGDIVLLVDAQSHRNFWPLGRVTKVFTGRDGLVRSVEIRTSSGTLVRPISKLCRLELE